MQTAFMKELIAFSYFSWREKKDFPLECGRYFFSVDDWMEGLRQDDFSMGTQFHGNVAAILAKVPALMIAIDDRMVELCRTHGIPYLKPEEFRPEKELEYYAGMADYSEFNRRYGRLYDNFLDYCGKNDVRLRGEEAWQE